MPVAPSSDDAPTPAQAAISRVLGAAIEARLLSDDAPVALFYNLGQLRANAAALRAAFPPTALHGFALKAAPLVALVRELHAAGLGGECASVAELGICRAAGLPPAAVIYDSPAKTDAHLRAALEAGVHLNADSLAEVARIDALLRAAPPAQPPPSVGLRVNPQIGDASIAETFTAAAASKFGEPLRECRAEIVAAFVRHPFLNTIHVHVGSQGCATDVLVGGASAAVALADEVNAAVAGRVRCIDIGGGLSVQYWGDEPVTTFDELGARLRAEVPRLFEYRVLTEFGRRVASDTAFIAARVEAIKTSGGKTFVVCHVGADLLMRPVYQRAKWGHRVEVYDAEGRLRTGEKVTADVAGPICFAGDIFAVGREMVLPRRGDIIVVRDTGAYTISMYCRHTSQLVPAVFGYEENPPSGDGGDSRKQVDPKFVTLKKQETVEDVVRFWGDQ